MAFSLIGVNITKIPENGGHEIQVEGVFEEGEFYEVYIGNLKTDQDSKCHSGKVNQGNNIYLWKEDILRCYSGLLTPAVTLSVSVQNMTTSQFESLTDVLVTTYQQFQSTVFGLRKVLPVFYKTGPRDIESVLPV